jgi:hypothetical protein
MRLPVLRHTFASRLAMVCVAELPEEVGSPGWARTSDFQINRRGEMMSRPSAFSSTSL